MCGRARLSSDVSELKVAFAIPPERPTPNFAASWNVAPTDPLPVVRYVAKDHQRSIEVMRWGLIPYWAKDEKIGFSTINAGPTRSTPTNPTFREPFRQRRCLVPVENFYEWKKTGKGKQPYAALVPSCPVWKGCRHSARRIGGRPLTHLRQSPERENYL